MSLTQAGGAKSRKVDLFSSIVLFLYIFRLRLQISCPPVLSAAKINLQALEKNRKEGRMEERKEETKKERKKERKQGRKKKTVKTSK